VREREKEKNCQFVFDRESEQSRTKRFVVRVLKVVCALGEYCTSFCHGPRHQTQKKNHDKKRCKVSQVSVLPPTCTKNAPSDGAYINTHLLLCILHILIFFFSWLISVMYFLHVYMYLYIYKQICIDVYIYIYIYVYIHIYIYIYKYIYIHTYMYICICMYIYIYVYKHIFAVQMTCTNFSFCHG